MKLNKKSILPLLSAAVLMSLGSLATAQDKVDKEPIVASIDPSKLTYDILVDGNLPENDPANNKFKSLKDAYEAAPEGTEAKPTVIGIRPNVYLLPGGNSGPSLSITKNWITLLGLTNNRRSVVLADNRGHMEGSQDNGYIVDVNANGFTLKNLTILDYVNCDYEYPGDPSKNLKMRNPTITQAVAFQSMGDKHVYENVAFLSRLDTTFLRTTRSYLKNVYIEGTDDFIGGGTAAVWEDCTVVFPTGRGVMSAGGIVFINTTFQATRGMEFSKGGGGRDVLINCTMPVNTPENPVACVRGIAPPRSTSFYLTYHTKDTSGKPAVISDGSEGPRTFESTREISDEEAKAFNPWNILRASPGGGGGRGGRGGGGGGGGASAQPDDWDPSHTREKYEALGEGNLVYRIAINNGRPNIRTGEQGAALTAALTPARATDQSVTWSTQSDLVTLSGTTGPNITVTGKNATSKSEYVKITATAGNGAYANTYVYVEPKYIASPTLSAAPKVNAPAGGKVAVSYNMDLAGNEDQSLISWYDCDDASGGNAREVATSRGNLPLKEYTLTSGDIGKYLRVSVAPKHQISDPGPAVFAIAASPIAASDVASSTVNPNFRNFIPTANTAIVPGMWSVIGTWTTETGDTLANGYGIRVASKGAALLYTPNGEVGDMQVDLVMTPEKTEGMGFGSPGSPADGDNNQKSDIYIKYDPITRNGYALRYWRTTESAEKCMYQFYKITDGAGTPLSDKKVFTGVFKPNTMLTLKVAGNTISATARNDVDSETLSLQDTIVPNRFGGTGVLWTGSIPRGNSNIYSQFKITYPDKKP